MSKEQLSCEVVRKQASYARLLSLVASFDKPVFIEEIESHFNVEDTSLQVLRQNISRAKKEGYIISIGKKFRHQYSINPQKLLMITLSAENRMITQDVSLKKMHSKGHVGLLGQMLVLLIPTGKEGIWKPIHELTEEDFDAIDNHFKN